MQTESKNTTGGDVYSRITNAIVEGIEKGAGKWRMPWHCDASTAFSPVSIRGLKAYRGINTLALAVQAQNRGYDSALWGTYQAWQELGGQVQKGEKGTLVCFWGRVDSTDDDGEKDGHLFCKGYSVFNLAQVDGAGLDKLRSKLTIAPKWERIEAAEAFFQGIGSDLRHGGSQAFYASDGDYIRMPLREQFHEADGYYSTLAHEHGHWTGHKARLSREFGKRFGDNAYAVEELVAELTAAFTMANLKLSNEPREDHAQYLASWLRVLKADKRAIFTAASAAQKAADYMREQAAVPALAIGRAA